MRSFGLDGPKGRGPPGLLRYGTNTVSEAKMQIQIIKDSSIEGQEKPAIHVGVVESAH